MIKRNIKKKIITLTLFLIIIFAISFSAFATTTVTTGSVDVNQIAGEATIHGTIASDSEILINASFRFDTINYVGGCTSMSWVGENFTDSARTQFEKKVSIQANKTYYYCITAFFQNPTTGEYHAQFGEVKSFITDSVIPQNTPVITTMEANSLTPWGATINSYIDPKGHLAVGFFRWSTTIGNSVPSDCTTLWPKKPDPYFESISVARNFSVELSGLQSNKRYYYCPVVQYWPSGFGSAFEVQGEMKYFDTLSLPVYGGISSVVTNSPATEVTSTSAKVSGSANPGGVDSVGYFRYSKLENVPPVFCNDIYGSDMKSTKQVSLGGGFNSMTFTTKITGLEPSTTYYYCAVASNKEIIKYEDSGKVYSFKTDPYIFSANPYSSIETENALVSSSSSVYLNGYYTTNVVADTWFEYKEPSSRPPAIPGATPGTILSHLGLEILNLGGLEEAQLEVQQNNTDLEIWEQEQENNLIDPTNIIHDEDIDRDDAGSVGWTMVGNKSVQKESNGPLGYSLTGLSPDTEYQFRAVIKGEGGTTIYGDTLDFKTNAENIITPTPDLCPNNPGTQTTLPCPTTPEPPIPCINNCGNYGIGTVTVIVNPSIPLRSSNYVNPLVLKANGVAGSTTITNEDSINLSSLGSVAFVENGRSAEDGSGIAGGDWSGNKVCPSTPGTPIVYPSFVLTNPFNNKSITKTFDLTCDRTSGGSVTSNKALVNISPDVDPSPAELILKANGAFAPITINSGEAVTLSAHGANFEAGSGVASRDWNGNKRCPVSIDTPTIYPSFTLVNPSTTTVMTKTYVLTCNRTWGPWIPTTNNFPTVTVTATPSSVSPGGSSIINWTSTNTTSCTLNNRESIMTLGNVNNTTSGSFSTGALTVGKSYTITCTGENGSASGNAYVSVATTYQYNPQCNDTLDNDNDRKKDVLDPNCHVNGDLTEAYIPTHYSESVSPTVTPPNIFPTVTVTATPSSVASGESSVISWTSKNATSCSAGIPYSTGTTGSFSTGALTTGKSYTVTCTGQNGSASGNAYVSVATTYQYNPQCNDTLDNDNDLTTDENDPNCHVNGDLTEAYVPTHYSEITSPTSNIFPTVTPPNIFPTVTVRATPSAITSGGTSTISWTSTNATSCNAGDGRGTGTTGLFSTGFLNSGKSYTVICTGTNGKGSGNASVFVNNTDPNPYSLQCSDKLDNDSDGSIDENDSNCHVSGNVNNVYIPTHYSESSSPPEPIDPESYNPRCNDSLDNDNDGKIDLLDPNCHVDGSLNKAYVPTHYSESNSPPTPGPVLDPTPYSLQCSDKLDNDGDGSIDENDSNCHVSGNINNVYIPINYSEIISPTVTPPNIFPTVKVTATPSSISSGRSSIISWTSTNATSCNAGDGRGTGTTGLFSTGFLNSGKSYTVICTGTNGTGSGNASVFVIAGGVPADLDPLVWDPNSEEEISGYTYTQINNSETPSTTSSGDGTYTDNENGTGTWSGENGFGTWNSNNGTWVNNTNNTNGTFTDNGNDTGTWRDNSGKNNGTWARKKTTTQEEFHLGQTATAQELDDAIVRWHEGVETVFQRQIKKNPALLSRYDYKDGDDLELFAWNLADQLAKTFGYINAQRKEIRVSKPDITAYRLRLEGNKLKVYEYNNFKIVNIQETTSTFKKARSFEYYYTKK